MTERLPRKVERAISIGLISAAAIGGYALGERGDSHNSAASKPRVVATAPATPKTTEAKPTPTTSTSKPSPTTTTHVLKKADMQPPLQPVGGDYNVAEDAAYNADQGDFSTAEKELAKITDPTVKTQAEHAVQVAYAEDAAYKADNGDIPTALSELQHVTLNDIKAKATEAVSYGIAEEAAYDASNGEDYGTAHSLESKITDPALVSKVEQTISQEKSGNTDGANNTWDDLYNTANNKWDDLYNQANNEWDTLYRHSDSYQQQYDQAK